MKLVSVLIGCSVETTDFEDIFAYLFTNFPFLFFVNKYMTPFSTRIWVGRKSDVADTFLIADKGVPCGYA